MRASDRQSGFTVLEALVALAILTGMTAAILSLLATTRAAQAHSSSRLTAALQAEALLHRIGHDIPLKNGSLAGSFSDGRTWSIFIQMLPGDVRLEGPRPHALYDVQVRAGNGRGADVELRTILRSIR